MTRHLPAVLILLCFCLSSCGRAQKQSVEGEAVSKEIFSMNTYITISACLLVSGCIAGEG